MKRTIWKDIPGYEGLYQVSNNGEVKSLRYRKKKDTQTILKSAPNHSGYLHVSLVKDGKTSTIQIHRLVAMAFIPNPNNYPVVNHKDWNVQNNAADNLEWCSHKYNCQYRKAADILPNEREEVFNNYVKTRNIKKRMRDAEYYIKNKKV